MSAEREISMADALETSESRRQADNPPTTNKGGSNTSQSEIEVSVGMDYLTVSLPRVEKAKQKLVALSRLFKTTNDTACGAYGYTGVDICGGYGQALFRPSCGKYTGDILLRFPGRALEWLRETDILTGKGERTTDKDICEFFVMQDFNATRIDLAMDTNDERVNPRIVQDFLNAGHFTSTAKTAGMIKNWKLHEEQKPGEGETTYIGGRTSTRCMRAYDKRADVLKKLKKDIGHRTRFEMENKGEAARAVLKLISEQGTACIRGLFRGWISFKDPADEATRIERRRNVDWWERMVGESESVVLGLSRGISAPEKTVHWLKHQVAKALFLVQQHGLMPEVEKAIADRGRRVRPSEWQKWLDYIGRLKAATDKEKKHRTFDVA